MLTNSKTQIVTNLKSEEKTQQLIKWQNLNCNKTWELKLCQNSKTQIMEKSISQIVTILETWKMSIYG